MNINGLQKEFFLRSVLQNEAQADAEIVPTHTFAWDERTFPGGPVT
jgi:hypothetical protein